MAADLTFLYKLIQGPPGASGEGEGEPGDALAQVLAFPRTAAPSVHSTVTAGIAALSAAGGGTLLVSPHNYGGEDPVSVNVNLTFTIIGLTGVDSQCYLPNFNVSISHGTMLLVNCYTDSVEIAGSGGAFVTVDSTIGSLDTSSAPTTAVANNRTRFPVPPDTGTYVLTSTDGFLSWEEP